MAEIGLADIQPFLYESLPARVIFGPGCIDKLEQEVAALGAERALILSTAEQSTDAERIASQLGSRAAGVFNGAVMHVPAGVVTIGLSHAARLSADLLIAIGGGSTIGLAKAMALETNLPILAIPTTYAGSEMTPIYGITQDGEKRTGKSRNVLPRTVIYDPELTVGLPVSISVTSSLNALAHAAEGLYAQDTNPIHCLIAEEGIRAIADGLPGLIEAPHDIERRTNLLYGAWLCGTVLGHVGMALHHKLCHTLGGSFNLPHAETHTVLLPHALAYNADAAPQAMRRIERALNSDNAPLGVHELALKNGAPISLKQLGMQPQDLDRAAEIACANPYWNPRPVERGALRELLQDAFDGAPPRQWN